MAYDYKKKFPELYSPSTSPGIIEVPDMQFIMIDGRGDPNTSPDYQKAVQALYSLAYSIRMGNKFIFDYVVPPLEGFWEVDDVNFKGGGKSIQDKSKFLWTMAIRAPEFVDEELFRKTQDSVFLKKNDLTIFDAYLKEYDEGMCVQIMHIGPYDDEAASVLKMDSFAESQGYKVDMHRYRRHHEIYISDPRRVDSSKLKTVLRHPICKV